MRGPLARRRRRRLERMMNRAFWRTVDVIMMRLRKRQTATPWVDLLEELEHLPGDL